MISLLHKQTEPLVERYAWISSSTGRPYITLMKFPNCITIRISPLIQLKSWGVYARIFQRYYETDTNTDFMEVEWSENNKTYHGWVHSSEVYPENTSDPFFSTINRWH